MSTIFPLAFAVSLFFSPDFLTSFGNGLGNGGIYFLGFLMIVFVFHYYTIKSYSYIHLCKKELNNEYLFIRGALGNITGFIFPFFTKMTMTVCLAVGILATAGYAFNELFIRWFPNMGFTLAALGFLLIIGLTGHRVVRIFQLIFSGISFSGIIILSVMGLFFSEGSLNTGLSTHSIQIQDMSFFFACFVLLMGFEMAKINNEGVGTDNYSLKGIMITALISGFLLFLIWGVATLMNVSPERISDTSIPHLITARAVSSHYGREIMGLVIIFGSMGAVNALFTYVSFIAGEMLPQELSFKVNRGGYRTIVLFVIVLIIAGLLISGMAGEPEFETFIRGGIYLWLLNYGVIHLSIFVFYKQSEGESLKSTPIKRYFNLIASIIIIGLYCGLILTDHERVLILKFNGIIVGSALLLFFIIKFINQLTFESKKGGIK